ncbi:hypothetical protein NQ315_013222 [Exocentrus adspersus]|uniref:NHR domain-containing protein n=1 Tax=Exocentrus adspersus TaxID=1586481 RepID=A0AAV8VDF0_9CUCU|nr:hypothetical protein NQ315_013222 [Exocentrus adspersus]
MEHNRMLESIESHSVLGMVSDGLPVRINLDLPYNILLPGRDEWERNKTDLLRADSCWYTDGSKTPEGAGAGVYSRRPRVEIADSLGQYVTVFQAEIHAIELCGRELEKWGPNRRTLPPKTSHAQNRPSGGRRLCMEDDETAEHVLCTCPAADRTRFSILGKVQLMPEDLDKYSPGKIIDFLRKLELLDLYGQAVEATIMDMYDYGSPDTMNSSVSNITLYSDLRFHHVHGKNARIVNNGLTALRPRPLAEFNDAIVFSNRPLRDGELFEICIDNIVDRWSGSIELGVTAVRPDDIELPSTATDLCRDTWMLSGSSVMINGKTIKNNYPCDLDTLTAGVRLGVMLSAEKSLEFYKDGIPQGTACVVPHSNIYAVVDLYGQCSQVSIPCSSPLAPLASTGIETSHRSDTSASLQATSVLQPPIETDLHRFSEFHGKGLTLNECGRLATRCKEFNSCVLFSATPLYQNEMFEVSIMTLWNYMAGTLSVGVTTTSPSVCNNLPSDSYYVTGWVYNNKSTGSGMKTLGKLPCILSSSMYRILKTLS